jgi:hypothetical protein
VPRSRLEGPDYEFDLVLWWSGREPLHMACLGVSGSATHHIEHSSDFRLIQGDATMATRALRVVKWLSSTPATGMCTACTKQFKVPMTALSKTKDAQESLQQQFDQHKCARAEGT